MRELSLVACFVCTFIIIIAKFGHSPLPFSLWGLERSQEVRIAFLLLSAFVAAIYAAIVLWFAQIAYEETGAKAALANFLNGREERTAHDKLRFSLFKLKIFLYLSLLSLVWFLAACYATEFIPEKLPLSSGAIWVLFVAQALLFTDQFFKARKALILLRKDMCFINSPEAKETIRSKYMKAWLPSRLAILSIFPRQLNY